MDNPKYYEQYNWEESQLKEKLQDKIKLLKRLIPNDVKTIVDIGCGDGTITNELKDFYKIIGIDRSFNALKYVKADKIQASADLIPIKPESIDLIFSSEMLEHLPEDIFIKTISELNNTTRKYLLLTFPDNENIEKHFVKCPNCSYVFNKSYHLRTINLQKITNLFPDFKIISYLRYGKKKRDYSKVLGRIKHKFISSTSWIPDYWTPDGRRDTMCPKCNKVFSIPYKFNIAAYFIELLNIVFTKKRPYQLFVLMEKLK